MKTDLTPVSALRAFGVCSNLLHYIIWTLERRSSHTCDMASRVALAASLPGARPQSPQCTDLRSHRATGIVPASPPEKGADAAQKIRAVNIEVGISEVQVEQVLTCQLCSLWLVEPRRSSIKRPSHFAAASSATMTCAQRDMAPAGLAGDARSANARGAGRAALDAAHSGSPGTR